MESGHLGQQREASSSHNSSQYREQVLHNQPVAQSNLQQNANSHFGIPPMQGGIVTMGTNKSIASHNSRISSSSREVSPNRYFGSGLPARGSKRSITPPHSTKLVSYNEIASRVKENAPVGPGQVYGFNNIHSGKLIEQNVVHSRVISEVEGRPIHHLPSGVDILGNNQVRPTSVIVERQDRLLDGRFRAVENQQQGQFTSEVRPSSSVQVREVRNVTSVNQPRQ